MFGSNWGVPTLAGSQYGASLAVPVGATSTNGWGGGITGSDFPMPTSIGSGQIGTPTLTSGMAAGRSPFGFNMDTAQLALSGLGTLGGLFGAFQAQKLAKEQFKYTKGITETNLANQIKTYNSGLTDRANNRAIVEGRTPEQTQAYITANSLSRFGR